MKIVRQAIQRLIDSAQIIGEILIYFIISVLLPVDHPDPVYPDSALVDP